MIVADTNVVSQLIRANGSQQVREWMIANADDLWTTTITLAELAYGIELIQDYDRKMALTNAVAAFRQQFDRSILEFDIAAADAHGWLQAKAKRETGRRLPELDAQIAAIAMARSASVATRNIRDFQATGLKLIDPWNP